MAFESLDQGLRIRAARSLDGFQDLRHRGIAQIAAGRRRVIVLVDHALDETLGTFRIDLRVPYQPPDPCIAGIAQRASDLFAADESSDTDLLLGQLQFRIALERIDEIPAIEIQYYCSLPLHCCGGEHWPEIGRHDMST